MKHNWKNFGKYGAGYRLHFGKNRLFTKKLCEKFAEEWESTTKNNTKELNFNDGHEEFFAEYQKERKPISYYVEKNKQRY